MKTITLSLQDEVYAQAEKEAQRRHKSLAAYLRDLVAGFRHSGETTSLPESAEHPSASRQQWLQRLREARATAGANCGHGPGTQEILDDIRADRL